MMHILIERYNASNAGRARIAGHEAWDYDLYPVCEYRIEELYGEGGVPDRGEVSWHGDTMTTVLAINKDRATLEAAACCVARRTRRETGHHPKLPSDYYYS